MEEQKLPKINTINQLNDRIGTVMLMADEGVIRLIVYTLLANRMRLGPVWSVIVAPPSGGKSELLQATYDLDMVYPLSSLTPQTFISGAHQTGGKSASLLDEIDNMTLVMKDLTTIVEMNKEDRKAIMGQFREIYDKRFDKAFGTGERKHWDGHVGMLGAITPAGADMFGSHGAMGERFIFYRMKQPDRIAVMHKALENEAGGKEKLQLRMRDAFSEYFEPRLANIDKLTEADVKAILSDKDTIDTVMGIADFATMARSDVPLDYKTGKVLYVHPHEMPTRFMLQLTGIACGGMYGHKFDAGVEGSVPGKLDRLDIKLMSDIAWGSIPPHRADIINLLAEYKEGSTKAIGARLGYETDVVRGWLTQLAALKLIQRDSTKVSGSDMWAMQDKWRDTISGYKSIKKRDESIEENAYGISAESEEPQISEAERDEYAKMSQESIEWFENYEPGKD
jgi:hypothetical protein